MLVQRRLQALLSLILKFVLVSLSSALQVYACILYSQGNGGGKLVGWLIATAVCALWLFCVYRVFLTQSLRSTLLFGIILTAATFFEVLFVGFGSIR
jgi:hypothetical protein